MDANNFLLNGGFALGGGLGSMPVALPYSLGGLAPGAAMQPSWNDLGMNSSAMQAAQMMPNQYPGSGQEVMDKMAVQDQARNNMAAMRTLAQGMQGMGRGGMQMPSGNTAQIIRDSNQFRFAGNPQQQMAQALRQRG